MSENTVVFFCFGLLRNIVLAISLFYVPMRFFMGRKKAQDCKVSNEALFLQWKAVGMRSINFMLMGGLGIFLADVVFTNLAQRASGRNSELWISIMMGIFSNDSLGMGYEATLAFLAGACLVLSAYFGSKAKGLLKMLGGDLEVEDHSQDPKIPELLIKYGQKSTEELERILSSDEHASYSGRAIFAMKKILEGRRETL
jgi:hypothetical protein